MIEWQCPWSQQVENLQVTNKTFTVVERSKHSLLACHVHRNRSLETPRNSVKHQLVERLKSISSLRKFYGRYGDLIQQYEVSLSRMLNDILTLDQQWLPNQSDFPPISWPWYRLWPSPNYEWFPWSICNRWHASRERFRTPGSVPHFGTC